MQESNSFLIFYKYIEFKIFSIAEIIKHIKTSKLIILLIKLSPKALLKLGIYLITSEFYCKIKYYSINEIATIRMMFNGNFIN